MTSAKSRQALQALTRARTVLLVSQPFYGTLALQLELVEVNDPTFVNTMAVDGRHFYYNPDFVLTKATEQELVGDVAHEISHCAYQHHTRRGDRHPTVWNYAGDYRINYDLKEAGFILQSWVLYDAKYKDMSTEEIYEALMKDAIIIKISAGPGSGGVEGKHGIGGVLDAPGDAVEKASNQVEWEGNVRMAAQVAAAQAGQLPGYIKRMIQVLNKPRISWRDQTREFVDESMQKDFSWARPNRRSVVVGALLPGTISDSMNHLVLVLDHSGSINDKVLMGMVSEAQGALDDRVADKLTIIYADDGVRKVDEYAPGDLVDTEVLGGGGTNFRPTFNWIRDNAPDASCVIYLTDMYTSDFGDEPACPVLWGVWGMEAHFPALAESAPFGRAIFVHPE